MICRKLMNMGTLLLAVVFLTLFFRNATHAQRVRMSIDDRVKMMTEQLSLTKDQADSVRKIYEATDKERTKVFGERQGGDRSAIREAMTKIMDDANKKIDSLLTDDQRKKFAEIKKQQQNRRGPPPDARQPEKKDNQ